MKSETVIDLEKLPRSARTALLDFYEFLLARRGQAKKKSAPRKLPAAFDTPIKVGEYQKVSRDEIYREI
jgi:hypothetical protein